MDNSGGNTLKILRNIPNMIILKIISLIAFIYLAFNVCYLFIFAIAGRLIRSSSFPRREDYKKIAVLIPSYKEDGIIEKTADLASQHNYPAEFFHVYVIADHLKEATMEKLSSLPITLIPVQFEKSTKAKSLKFALRQMPVGLYDILLILDADNHMENGCLLKINDAFAAGCTMVQLHRTAKNKNTTTAILDAASEEINNHLFRKGHRALGLSAALIGSGMAFDYELFTGLILPDEKIDDNPGEDREINLKMLEAGHVCEYIDDIHVYDEKVQSAGVFENQRTRWISAQMQYAKRFWISEIKKTLSTNIHYFDYALQTLLLPRVMLLVVLGLAAVVCTLSQLLLNATPYPDTAWWWAMLAVYIFTLLLSIYGHISLKEFIKALAGLPAILLSFFRALLRSRTDQKEFIHTPKEFIKD